MFCGLEKYNGTQKFVPQLIVENENGQDKVITDQKGVENQIFGFYNNLFENKDDEFDFCILYINLCKTKETESTKANEGPTNKKKWMTLNPK